MQKVLVLFFFILLQSNPIFSQSPYQLNWKADGPILGVSLVAEISAHLIELNREGLSIAELNTLDPLDVNAFDRRAIDRYSETAASVSDYLVIGSYLATTALLINKKTRSDFGTLAIMWLEVALINDAITTYAKTMVLRPRPYTYGNEASLEVKMDRNGRFSFFSGHTSHSAAMCFFTAKVINDYFPEEKWRWGVWAGAAVIPALTGYMRFAAGRHFPTDMIVGYGVGALTGILIPHFHKKKDASFSILPVMDSGQGITLLYTF